MPKRWAAHTSRDRVSERTGMRMMIIDPKFLHGPLTGIVLALGLLGAAGATAGPIERIDVTRLDALIQSEVTVVDIRRADEWRETGVIPGSRLITAFDGNGRLEPEFVERLRAAVGKDQPVVLICRSGNRSAAAARLLADGGASATIYDVAGGVRAWVAAGHALAPCPQC